VGRSLRSCVEVGWLILIGLFAIECVLFIWLLFLFLKVGPHFQCL
jgi:hypothetical protein